MKERAALLRLSYRNQPSLALKAGFTAEGTRGRGEKTNKENLDVVSVFSSCLSLMCSLVPSAVNPASTRCLNEFREVNVERAEFAAVVAGSDSLHAATEARRLYSRPRGFFNRREIEAVEDQFIHRVHAFWQLRLHRAAKSGAVGFVRAGF